MSTIANRCSSPLHVSTYEVSGSVRLARYLRVKSFLDKVIAAILLLLASPIILAAMIAVRLTSSGPVLFKQIRVGLGGRSFQMYKIRSMFHDCESRSGPQWSKPGDTRVTFIGRFLRLTHIDELPQLVNVLRGEMSLVGPRPERPVFVDQLVKVLPRYRERLLAPPGITGLAQVQLKADTDLRSVATKLTCDLFYIQSMSLCLDLQILLCTPFHLLGIPFSVLHWLFRVPTVGSLQCTCAKEAEEWVSPTFQGTSAVENAGR